MGKNKTTNKKVEKPNKKRKFEDDNEVEEKVTSVESFEGQCTNEPNYKNGTEEENGTSQDLQASVSKKLKNHKKPKGTNSKKILDVNEPEQVKTEFIKPEKMQHMNYEEAEVKDEDIDKFCEELNDEDNVQYENWVKLIEANFRSNKKKP